MLEEFNDHVAVEATLDGAIDESNATTADLFFDLVFAVKDPANIRIGLVRAIIWLIWGRHHPCLDRLLVVREDATGHGRALILSRFGLRIILLHF